jgi:hypothetical protein
VWRDLKVIFDEHGRIAQSREVPKGEFHTAFVVMPESPPVKMSLNGLRGAAKSLKRDPVSPTENGIDFTPLSPDDPLQVGDIFWYSGSAEAIGDLRKIYGLDPEMV